MVKLPPSKPIYMYVYIEAIVTIAIDIRQYAAVDDVRIKFCINLIEDKAFQFEAVMYGSARGNKTMCNVFSLITLS